MARIANDIGAMYRKLLGYLSSKGTQPLGIPFAEYFE
jgi:hypothetical protein